MTINLGDVVKDTLTGLKGTVIGRTEWLYGCVRVIIQPTGVKDGKTADVTTVDEPQCVVIKKAKSATVPPRHGPKPEAIRSFGSQRH